MIRLFEYADHVTLIDGRELRLNDDGAYPFMYLFDDEFFIGYEGSTHIGSIETMLNNNQDSEYLRYRYDDDLILDDYLYTYLDNATYRGRIWKNDNVITFWDLTEFDKSKLKEIISKLESEFNIKINPKEWWVEYYNPDKMNSFFVLIDDYYNGNTKYGILGKTQKDVELRKKWHELNPIEKEKYQKKPSYYKSKPLAWKQALLTSEKKVYEYADYIKLPNGKFLQYSKGNTYPFMYYNNEFIIGYKHDSHYDTLESHLMEYDTERYDEYVNRGFIDEDIRNLINNECKYTGRVWLDDKIIAFWNLKKSEKQILIDVINKLNDKFKKNIDETWWLEFYDSNDEILYFVTIGDYYKNNFENAKVGSQLNYINKENIELRKKWHQLNPTEKERYKQKPSYYKSKPLAWKQALLTSESNTPNELIYDNNKLNWYDNDARSFGFIKGKPYISDYKTTHINLPFKYGFKDFQDIIGKGNILKLNDAKKIRNGIEYAGRIWDDRKVISFWNYPESKEKLKYLLNLLKKEDKSFDFQEYLVSLPFNEFVKVDDYKYNNYKQNTDIEHVISPLQKKNNIIPKGVGSKKYRPIELKYKLYQESKDIMVNERLNTIMQVPKDIKKFHNIFRKNGFKLFVVGGAVRDFLMGKIPHDYDLVTNALPDDVVRILKSYRTNITGAHFGVVRVYTSDEPSGYEIASYRKDISKGRDTKGKDKKVELGKHLTVKDDVRRRDLTINALFYDLDNHQIVDVVGGMNDIKNKIVRAVGEPSKRFEEDRLRILRTLRFAAVTNSKIDKETSDAIIKDNRLFGISDKDDVSRERIFKEFINVRDKSRDNNDPDIVTRFVDLLIDYGILGQIFPVLITEKNIRPTKYLSVALAQTLRNNNPNNEFRQTLIDAKIPGKYVDIISFLIKIFKSGVDENNIYDLYKEMTSKGIRRDILEDWIKVMGIYDKKVLGLLNYRPSIVAKDVIDDGFKGAGIGIELRKRESEKFLKMIK